MSTDASTFPEAEFHSRLFVRLRDFVAGHPDTPFSDVSIETPDEGRRADIFVERRHAGNLLIEVERDTVDPRTRGAVVRGRDHDADVFVACNSNDLFVFDDSDERETNGVDYYYLDLRTRPLAEIVPSIVEAVDHRRREGRLPDQSRRDRLAGTLRSFHGSIWPAFRAAASDAYGTDPEFTDTFDEWVDTNDYRDRDRSERFEIAAKQYAYLLMNRILFYEVVRRRSDPTGGRATAASGFPPKPLSHAGGDRGLDSRRTEDRLRDSFENAVTGIGDRPVFATDSGLFESFPHNERTRTGVSHLIRTVESDPITGIDGDLPGGIYEELIPEDERKALGQFYTHPTIAETIVRWALQTGDGNLGTAEGDTVPSVLDPASGSGAFVVEAYRYLTEQFPDASHQELVDHVLAVDVNRFPLHLTAIGLAGQRISERTDRVHAYHSSFFDLDPTTDVPVDSRIDVFDDGGHGGEIGLVDAVVGNPPFIEADDLDPNKAHFRDHLREFGPEGSEPYRDGPKGIGANADAYVYFLTHATQFLRDGGRLGFVVPTKWMTSRYGEQFQQFLYDHYRIDAVVGFDARTFEDALVDTALLFLQKCSDGQARRGNVVEFVRVDGTVTPETILGAIDCDRPPGEELTVGRTGDFRAVGVRQSRLEEILGDGKVARYLVAPGDLIELVESPELAELGELADIERGAMTGSTSFFFPDREDVEAHGIEDRFLLPALKSMRGYDTVVYGGGDVDRWFVDVHEYVREVRGRPTDDPLETAVKDALEDDGYTGLRSWIRHAEAEDEHRGATCRNRDVWFDFGEPPRPDILFQKLLRERLFSIYNRAGAVPSNAVDCIDVHDDVDPKALLGVLNSSIVLSIMEVRGRNEAGMLQLMTYETESLPVPDVRSMSREERSAIVSVVDDILERGDSELSAAHRDRLDAAVLDALDLSVDLSVERIQEIQQSMLDRRIGSGDP